MTKGFKTEPEQEISVASFASSVDMLNMRFEDFMKLTLVNDTPLKSLREAIYLHTERIAEFAMTAVEPYLPCKIKLALID